MHTTAQVENPEAPMASNQLAQGEVHGFALRAGSGEPLCFAHHLVVDLDVGPHTQQLTPPMVY